MARKRPRAILEKPEEYFSEAVRYYANAQERLAESKTEYNRYKDLKPVREACGTAYLAVLLALDGYFVERGADRENLPSSVEEYQKSMNKYLVHNGKIRNAFFNVYEVLHLWGYYRGIGDVDVAKDGFGEAKRIIETLTGMKVL